MVFITKSLALIIIAAPSLLVAVLGLCLLVGRPLNERTTSRLVGLMLSIGLVAAVFLSCAMFLHNSSHVTIELGNWIDVKEYNVRNATTRVSV